MKKIGETDSSPKSVSPRNNGGTQRFFPSESPSPRPTATKQFFPLDNTKFSQQMTKDSEKQEPSSSTPTPESRLESRRMSLASMGRRKSSNALNTQTTQPKYSFKALGGKVTSLVRAKMAFQKTPLSSIDDKNEITVIRELPKEPRFAASLSPEAQFAIMKGYEDNVYGYLCNSNPEYKHFLKRNKTPTNQEVDIKDVSRRQSTIDVRNNPNTPPSVPAFTSHASEYGKSRAMSISVDDARPNTTSRRNRSLSRAQSLPALVPRDKQLVLTYRLQSAMDILDTLRSKEGENPISPRISSSREIKPLADYNLWTKVWKEEFKTKS